MAAVYVEAASPDFWQLARKHGKYIDKWGPKDCTTHSMARTIMRHFQGLQPPGIGGDWPPTGEFIRSVTRNADGTLDREGGNNLNQMAAVGQLFYGFSLRVRKGMPFDDFVTMVEAGRGALVQLWYEPIRVSALSGSETFFDNHAIFVSGVDRAAGVFTNVVDPLADGRRHLFKGPANYPIELIRDAAGRLNVAKPKHYRALGAGLINAGFTQVTSTPSAPLAGAAAAAEVTVHFAPGAIVRKYRLGSAGCITGFVDATWGPLPSQAPGTSPVSRPTCNGLSSATTSRITAGAFAGKTIRVQHSGVTLGVVGASAAIPINAIAVPAEQPLAIDDPSLLAAEFPGFADDPSLLEAVLPPPLLLLDDLPALPPEDFPPAAANEPLPPEDADLDASSDEIYDEAEEIPGDGPDADAGAGKGVS